MGRHNQMAVDSIVEFLGVKLGFQVRTDKYESNTNQGPSYKIHLYESLSETFTEPKVD